MRKGSDRMGWGRDKQGEVCMYIHMCMFNNTIVYSDSIGPQDGSEAPLLWKPSFKLPPHALAISINISLLTSLPFYHIQHRAGCQTRKQCGNGKYLNALMSNDIEVRRHGGAVWWNVLCLKFKSCYFKSVLNLNGMETSRRGKIGDGTIHTLEAVGTDGKGGNGTDFTGVIFLLGWPR